MRSLLMIDSGMLYDGADGLARTLIVGVLAYASIVFLLRISGRRTLSKMNAFDFIVTVALGSTLATVLLNRNVPLADGVLAFGVLIGLQFVVTWTCTRLKWVQQLVTGEPLMLLYRGDCLPRALRQARVTENEVRAAVRSAGFARLDDVGAVVLETDGSFSVVPKTDEPGSNSLEGVKRLDAPGPRDPQSQP
jgi:uncharacterized membrane protein YcaP (DUF421 family)